MLRLVAADDSVVLTKAQVGRIKHLLLEFIPASRCEVSGGPGVEISLPNHTLDELAPGIRAAVEATIGCAVHVEELPD